MKEEQKKQVVAAAQVLESEASFLHSVRKSEQSERDIDRFGAGTDAFLDDPSSIH